MKRNLIVALALVALSLLTVSTSFAQDKVRADVPFSFQVGKSALPAGTYTVSEINGHSIVIRSREDASAAALTNFNSAEKLNSVSPRMVFHKYGDNYFLAEIWNGDNIGMQLPESKREKELQASNWAPNSEEFVIVAMK